MQSKDIICKDARTFGEIWESLPNKEKNELFADLVKKGITYNKITIWFWAKRKRCPRSHEARVAIVDAVHKITGVQYDFYDLFPPMPW